MQRVICAVAAAASAVRSPRSRHSTAAFAARDSRSAQPSVASLQAAHSRCRRSYASSDAAEEALDEALVVAEQVGLPAPAWEAHACLAALLAETGRQDEAEDHARRARLGLERLGLPLSEADRRIRVARG